MSAAAKVLVVQAYDRQAIAEIDADDAAALESKLASAHRAFRDRDAWLPVHERIDVLRRLAALMETRRDHFSRRIAQEGGKPLPDAIVETTRAIDGVRNAADELRNFAGGEIPMGLTAASAGRLAFTTREPIGVVAAISAFNHPLNLVVHQVAPAIAVGCPVIVKPAIATPLCCLDFVALVREAGVPEAWCQTFVTADNALAEQLATDRRVAYLSFIGSARVGWYLRSRLPPGTRCALEHGGAAPAIVDRSANLDALIGPMVKGGYYHAGQVCVSTQRIYVHASLMASFLDRFVARVVTLRVGDPLSADTEVGPLIAPREVDRVQAWVNEAVTRGAKLAAGGKRRSATVMEPTVLVEPAADVRVSKEEVFGPVCCVYAFDRLDDAIERANALPYAFQASVFADDIDAALYAAERLDASAVMINDHTAFRTDWMPFAGRRESGYGVGGIPFSMREMAHEKMRVFRSRV